MIRKLRGLRQQPFAAPGAVRANYDSDRGTPIRAVGPVTVPSRSAAPTTPAQPVLGAPGAIGPAPRGTVQGEGGRTRSPPRYAGTGKRSEVVATSGPGFYRTTARLSVVRDAGAVGAVCPGGRYRRGATAFGYVTSRPPTRGRATGHGQPTSTTAARAARRPATGGARRWGGAASGTSHGRAASPATRARTWTTRATRFSATTCSTLRRSATTGATSRYV